jgi:adenylate cyclase class 1
MTAKAAPDLASRARSMERVLYPPRPDDWGRMASYIKRLVNSHAAMDPYDPEQQRIFVRFTRYLRVAISSTIDINFLGLCLRAMLNIGREGWLAASQYVSSSGLGHNDMATLLRGLRPVEQLLLANQWLLQKSDSDGPLRRMLLELASASGGSDTSVILNFFSQLGQERVPVFFPLKAMLLESDFGKKLREMIAEEQPGHTDIALARALFVLEEPELTHTFLLARMDGMRMPGEYVWQLASTYGGHGGRGSDALAKAVCRYLSRGDSHVRQRAVDTLICLDWPKTGLVLARLFTKTSSMRKPLAPRLLVLGERDFIYFIKSLKQADQRHLYRYIFSLLCSLAPEFVLRFDESGELSNIASQKIRQDDTSPEFSKFKGALMRVVRETDEILGKLVPSSRAGNDVGGYEPDEGNRKGKSFFSRILGRQEAGAEALFQKKNPIADLSLNGASLHGVTLRKRRMEECRLRSSLLHEVDFRHTRILNSGMSGCRIQAGGFASCVFEYVDFTETVFQECRFDSCRFVRCHFTSSLLKDCTFVSCEFEECLLDSMVVERGCVRLTGFTGSTLHSAAFSAARIEAVRFSGSYMGRTIWRKTTLLGCEFSDCDMPEAQCLNCSIQGGCVTSTRISGNFIGCLSDLPDFQEAAALALRQQVAVLGGVDPDSFHDSRPLRGNQPVDRNILEFTATKSGLELCRKVVHLWARHWSFARNESAMLRTNAQRYAFFASRSEEDTRDFLDLLPLLLSTDVGHAKLGLDTNAFCPTVSCYMPSHSDLTLCRERFGRIPDDPFAARKGLIAAIYSIGSLGTMAQTRESDFDCWVCLEDSADFSEEQMRLLRAKLHALECYSWDTLGLETHFFLMSMDDVRNNRFGFSDKESSGSAQALLLKDEFYRTALRVAGKSLAWWLMPPAVQAREYRDRVADALIFPLGGASRIADLGGLEEIPREEFFGACLWQMVKAVKSPFKTVMKFGLLERYARRLDKKAPLLCERIRMASLNSRESTFFGDPYAALFAEVAQFYSSLGLREAERLVAEAFMQRVGSGGIPTVLGYASTELEQLVLREVFEARGVEPAYQDGSSKWGFRKKKRMGESVNHFILDTYKRIHDEGASEHAHEACITEEDLTRLGRQILAIYAPKPEKIRLVPFLGGDNSSFGELVLEALKSPGKATVWVAKGAGRSSVGGSAEELTRDANLFKVLAWLACNGIFATGIPLRLENAAPLAMEDVLAILGELAEFIPFSGMVASDLDVFLEEEKIARVYCALNLTVPREVKDVKEVGMIYKTTWGEVFTRRIVGEDARDIARFESFFAKHLPLACSGRTEYRSFLPKRALCARIRLP